MPTGYTRAVVEGATFEQYLQSCARAFIIQLRDEPMDKPLPRSITPNTYHADELARTTEERTKLLAMSRAELEAAAELAYQDRLSYWNEHQERRRGQLVKYQEMLAKVQTWQPPTEDHINLKKFMISQLDDSIRHDCGDDFKYYPKPEPMTAEAYFQDRLSTLDHGVEYHGKHAATDTEGYAKLNAWLEALHKSMEKS